MKKTSSLFLLLWLTTFLFGQKTAIEVKFHSLKNAERYDAALDAAQEWLEQAQKENRQRGIAQAQFSIGLMAMELNEMEQAEQAFLAALGVWEQIDSVQSPAYTEVSERLAKLYRLTKRYENSEAIYQKVLILTEKRAGKNSMNYASMLNNMGLLYIAKNERGKAIQFFMQAIDIVKKLKMDEGEMYIKMLNNLAICYRRENRLEEAEKLYKVVIDWYSANSANKMSEYASILNNLAKLYVEMGRFDEAEALFFRNIALVQKIYGEKHSVLSNVLTNMAKLYEGENQPQKAINTIYQSLMVNGASNLDTSSLERVVAQLPQQDYILPEQTINSLNRLSYIVSKFGGDNKEQLLLGIASAGQQLLHRFASEFGSEVDKLGLLQSGDKLWGIGLNAISHLPNESANIEIGIRLMEQAKSTLLASAIKNEKARTFGILDSATLKKEKKLQKKLLDIRKQQAENKDATLHTKINEQLSATLTEIDVFEKEIKAKYPDYYKLKYENYIPDLKSIQAALPNETVLLEYHVSEERVYVIRIQQTDAQLFATEIAFDTLALLVSQLREQLTNYEYIKNEPQRAFQEYCDAAYRFYLAFLDLPLRGIKQGSRLVIVADNLLGYIPFEAIISEKPDANSTFSDLPYLLHQYKIGYSYSAALFKEYQDKPTGNNNRQIFAATVDYSSLSPDKMQHLSHTQRKIRAFLAPLPAAKTEIEDLGKLLSGSFLADVSESEFKQQAPQFGVLHLAVHGLLDSKSPILSSLALGIKGDSTEDGFLQSFEISQMRLNADLVVLSACETGYGRFVQGEGVLSLARSFMYAGVPSLLVSLWQVNDASTAQIMSHFYQELSAGKDKTEALKNAKINYLQKSKGISAHPAFWSPFIQVGNSNDIPLQGKGGWNMWLWLALGAAVCTLAAFFFLRRARRGE